MAEKREGVKFAQMYNARYDGNKPQPYVVYSILDGITRPIAHCTRSQDANLVRAALELMQARNENEGE